MFLYKEEISFINQLEKEKEKTKKRLQNNEAMLEKQSLELKNYILELEKKCQGSAQNLLQVRLGTWWKNGGVCFWAIMRRILKKKNSMPILGYQH